MIFVDRLIRLWISCWGGGRKFIKKIKLLCVSKIIYLEVYFWSYVVIIGICIVFIYNLGIYFFFII